MKNDPAIHVIVLAAGLSRRMGKENKLLLSYGGGSMLAEVLTQILMLNWASVTVVTGHERRKVGEVVKKFGVQECYNPDFAEGQGSSIRAGVASLPTATEAFLIALGDMPLLQTTHYRALREAFATAWAKDALAILRPVRKGRPGHPVFFSAAHRSSILDSKDTEGARSVIKGQGQHLVPFPTTDAAYFWDVDTPQAYRELPSPDKPE